MAEKGILFLVDYDHHECKLNQVRFFPVEMIPEMGTTYSSFFSRLVLKFTNCEKGHASAFQ
jgi:hypothetical protein